jgi:hypothetical protein
MDKLVRRIVKLDRSGGKSEPTVIFEKGSSSDDEDGLSEVAERTARRMLRAEHAFTAKVLRLHDESERDDDGGWVIDAPANIASAHRKAYNIARKGAPMGILPKFPKI